MKELDIYEFSFHSSFPTCCPSFHLVFTGLHYVKKIFHINVTYFIHIIWRTLEILSSKTQLLDMVKVNWGIQCQFWDQIVYNNHPHLHLVLLKTLLSDCKFGTRNSLMDIDGIQVGLSMMGLHLDLVWLRMQKEKNKKSYMCLKLGKFKLPIHPFPLCYNKGVVE